MNTEFNQWDDIECWLLDMDGTIYLEDHLIDGASDFLHHLMEHDKRFIFLTNNSSKNANAYVEKLHALGLSFIKAEHIYTSGQATIAYISENFPSKDIYLLGTNDLESEFCEAGFRMGDNPAVVVIGFDTTLTYAKLWKVCDLVRGGLPYIATHPDFNCPTRDGFMPDIGAIIAFVKASTGREPDVVVGKPNLPMLNAISRKTRLPLGKIAMVGDRLYTDIAFGKHGIHTVLVLTGETKREDLADSPFHPELVLGSIAELIEKIS